MEVQTQGLTLDSRAVLAEVLSRRPEVARGSAADRSVVVDAARRDAVEVLVPDSRAELSPAQSVENKLTSMLRGTAIPVSHIRLARLRGRH